MGRNSVWVLPRHFDKVPGQMVLPGERAARWARIWASIDVFEVTFFGFGEGDFDIFLRLLLA
jgi:hypothetical protein